MQNFEKASLLLSSPNLLCQETVHDHDGEEDCCLSHQQQNDDDEYVEMLLHREINSGGSNGLNSLDFTGSIIISASWMKEARLNTIQYIINASLLLGFKIETTYLALTYLDRFLSKKPIEDKMKWAIRLLAISCLSLAAKMKECKVPPLSDFPVPDYNFECNVIRRMELLVLDTLDWRMSLATPFNFIHYFASKLCQSNSIMETVSGVIDTLSATIKSKNVEMIYHTPSAIAAAATLLTLDQSMTRESLLLKINTLSSSRILKIDDIISFYNQMKESYTLLNRSIVSPVLSPVILQIDAIDNVGSSLITSSGVLAKRKTLTFTDDENGQNSKRHNSSD